MHKPRVITWMRESNTAQNGAQWMQAARVRQSVDIVPKLFRPLAACQRGKRLSHLAWKNEAMKKGKKKPPLENTTLD